MRNWLLMFPSLLLSLWPGLIWSQDFSGSYQLQQDEGAITVKIVQDPKGAITGVMHADGTEYALKGKQQGESATGTLSATDETLRFTARFIKGMLALTLSAPSAQPGSQADSETLIFQRTPKPATSQSSLPTQNKPPPKAMDKPGTVKINGVTLSQDQINGLHQAYGAKPLPGNYWYDAKSGLYGVIGFQAFGFMRPGHEFGKPDPNASRGNTGVFVNGRQLPQSEWGIWSQILGYMIQPGRYWLDANGNAGYEGNPIPTENLYLAAQRNAYRGGGHGGSDTWSSRFSSGGYDSGGERGYVSVPGYGPVGYGF